jgi:polyferredoxin
VEKTKNAPLTEAQKRKKRMKQNKILRAGVQLVFFVSMPGAFVAGFTGVKNLFGWISGGQVLQMNSFVKALIGLALFTILFGRYFCGYVCAFGSLGDLVYWLSGLVQKKVLHRKKQISMPKKALPWLQKLKYLNLVFIIVLCAFGLYTKLSGSSPWDVFSRLTALQAVPEGYLWGCVALGLILIGMAVQERFFCQFLCPMGAVFALIPILPWGMLQRREDLCIRGCNACADQCPVGLKLKADGHRNGECIGCEKCASTCPKGNISHREQKIIPSEPALVLGKAVIFFVLGVYLGFCRFL